MTGRCFNDCTPETNGEIRFYNSIKDRCQVIFDVGARDNSSFFDFPREVHYFEPEPILFGMLALKEVANSAPYFNNFGLSDASQHIPYYNDYSSFLHRKVSVPNCPDRNETLEVRRGDEYLARMRLLKIDFLKIDTEGYEFKVIKGFGERIKDVKIIQFEYGGTYLDAGIGLKDVLDYLKEKGFKDFNYLHGEGLEPLIYTQEHYSYCNIVCFR